MKKLSFISLLMVLALPVHHYAFDSNKFEHLNNSRVNYELAYFNTQHTSDPTTAGQERWSDRFEAEQELQEAHNIFEDKRNNYNEIVLRHYPDLYERAKARHELHQAHNNLVIRQKAHELQARHNMLYADALKCARAIFAELVARQHQRHY